MRSARGFSLLEVVMATAILTIGATSLAQLATLASRANVSAASTTTATLLAQSRMEQLRGLVWALDVHGAPISDVAADVSVVPAAPSGGVGLSPSPSGALARNVPGYCDFVDESGRSLGSGVAPPAGTTYIRRWAIEPMPAFSDSTLILQVLVLRARGGVVADTAGQDRRLPDEARLVSVKTRKAY